MTHGGIRRWRLVHKWSSLICTGFLLMLCLTGLPLIFHEEIDAATGANAPLPRLSAPATERTLDSLIAGALKSRPGEVPLFLSFDDHRPVVNLTSGPRGDAPDSAMHFVSLDRRTGQPVANGDGGVMDFLLELHTDMFLGAPAMYFLGAMGLLFVAAIVSGVVLYVPFTRRLDFTTVRHDRTRRILWLDWHNLLGVVTLGWATVVGVTGTINTLSGPITAIWKASVLEHIPPGRDIPGMPARPGSADAALALALHEAPGMKLQFIAFPGTDFSSKRHLAVFLQGNTPLTSHLPTGVLVEADSGRLAGVVPMPWYAKALLLSQPLHFGDYGGIALKVLWALLDIVTIIVLGSGLYLWLAPRRAAAVQRAATKPTTGDLAAARLDPAE